MHGRLRRTLVLAVTLAMSLVAPAATVRATGALDLTGERLFASAAVAGAGQDAVTWHCEQNGTSTFSFIATGIATGPYPGTFVATGSGTIGAQFVPPNQGVQVGPINTWESAFTITWAGGTIMGTTSVAIGYLGGYCVEPVQPNPFSGINLGLQTATFDASQGSDTDAGNTSLTSSYLCQDACADAFEQKFRPDVQIGTVPGPPRGVTAAAGDQTLALSWLPPSSDGGQPITNYWMTAFVGANSQTFSVGIQQTTLTFSGIDNDLTIAFAVAAENINGRGPDSELSAWVTTRAGAPEPQLATEAIAPTGGAGTTDPGHVGPTPADPVTTDVTVPSTTNGGTLSISETSLDPAPTGYVFFGQQVVIESTAATDTTHPLAIVFHMDPSLVPATIFRNGVPIDQACSPAGTASPAPCIASGAGTATITILTDHASTWNVGMRAYSFSGFFSPVDKPPVVNSVKAGSAIPIRFGLGSNRGLQVFATGYPKSQRVTCDSASPIDAIEETVSTASVLLTYSAGTNLYQYTWKTDKAWAGTCRKFTLTLRDGSVHEAIFTFK
jgi:hypothetical protein